MIYLGYILMFMLLIFIGMLVIVKQKDYEELEKDYNFLE